MVNSFGQTQSFFKTCKTVFLGGSIIKHGGQNPLEAAKFGCQILHGPNIWNFKEIYALLKTHKVSSKVIDTNQLLNKVDQMLSNKSSSNNLKIKIRNIGNKILRTTLNEVNFYINK